MSEVVKTRLETTKVEIIDVIELSKVPYVFEPIMHKVHRPNLNNCHPQRQRLGPLTHQALSGLDAQYQFLLPVDAVHALVIPA